MALTLSGTSVPFNEETTQDNATTDLHARSVDSIISLTFRIVTSLNLFFCFDRKMLGRKESKINLI